MKQIFDFFIQADLIPVACVNLIFTDKVQKMKFDDYAQTYVDTYTEFAEIVCSLLKNAIEKVEGLPRLQATQARAKRVESLKRKLEERGLLNAEHIESEIKDLAGIRLIFYTNTDVDRFLNVGLIQDIFDVDWKETRVHHPTDDNNQRRYQGIHYTVLLREHHTALPEYKQFKGMRCEVQLQTILNHAWSETQHDMIYHATEDQGFGTAAKRALDKRLMKIMDEYLRPAGYEFQKVQHDYERLMQGKALFDRGAIETLESCDNNNERHEILSTIAEHVIPNYDDIKSVYPEIRHALEVAVQAARNTETQPIKSPFGNLPGKTSKDVTLAVVDILNTLCYVDVKTTFRSLTDIYEGEQDAAVRKQIVEVIKRLAKYDLNIWNKAGPYVQAMLADVIENFPPEKLHILRPIALVIWRESLKSEMESTAFSRDTFTIKSSALPVFEQLKNIRNRAIDGLLALFDASGMEKEKREALASLQEATRLPAQAKYSNALLQLTLEDAKKITDSLAQRALGQPYEFLEHLENGMRFDYLRIRHSATEDSDPGCKQAAESAMEAIIVLRDRINADQQYVRYKTLVGYESVFSFDWDSDRPDFSAIRQYRMEQVTLYIDHISEETSEEWHRLIERCAVTKSNGTATFPIFGEFLHQLSKVKPHCALMLAQRNNAELMRFLSEILNGLYESDAHDVYAHLLEDYLNRNAYLTELARHCQWVKESAADTLKKILDKAIAIDQVNAVFECLFFAIKYHDPQELPLVESIFVPAITYLMSKRNAQWIYYVYYLPECQKFFEALPSKYADLVLENLLDLSRIDYDAECILAPIALNQPASVWEFFSRRVKEKKDREGRYEALSYEFHELRQELAKTIDIGIALLRTWFHDGDPLFRYTGGRLMQAVCPAFSDELASCLQCILTEGSEEDYDFVIRILENYNSAPATHEIIKELIERLPEDDPKLNRLAGCLSSVGVVLGEFGIVDAHRQKKEEIALWKQDTRPKVRKFADSYVKGMEQDIASKQRSSEMRRELMLRDYEAEGE